MLRLVHWTAKPVPVPCTRTSRGRTSSSAGDVAVTGSLVSAPRA
ncbi:MAG: hypothetical protein QM767_19590 [Anaeromyxobacter sp.]